jgi:hypothetical protein
MPKRTRKPTLKRRTVKFTTKRGEIGMTVKSLPKAVRGPLELQL